MSDQKKLIIIGAGGHGRVAADIARLNGYQVSFLDDRPHPGLPVIGVVSEYGKYLAEACFFIALGNNRIRKEFQTRLQKDAAEIISLIHPKAVIAEECEIGAGTVVMAGAVVNPGAKIGSGVIINTSSSVDHDCAIGDYVHISVGSHIAGTVTVGEGTMIGAGATVINNLRICEGCTVGAGAVVVKDIQEPGTYVGVPARQIKP